MTPIAAVFTALLLTVTASDPTDPSIATIGAEAPDFELRDLDGRRHRLSSFRGRRVVLEWFNPDCPFVQYAHTKGPLRHFGNGAQTEDIVWLAIDSTAPRHPGAGVEANRESRERYRIDYPVLIDESGAVGRSFQARNTPQIFLIDEQGILVYRGGVDNAPLGDTDGRPVVNYLELAIADLAKGDPVKISETPSYGCRVKYAPHSPAP